MKWFSSPKQTPMLMRFEPKPDITLLELAEIVQRSSYAKTVEITPAQFYEHKHLMRHFVPA